MGNQMQSPRSLKALYREGRNIAGIMRHDRGVSRNTTEIVEVAYDIQAGSYVASMADQKMRSHKEDYGREIAAVISSLCRPGTVLEAGVGEATTMAEVMMNLASDIRGYGFDLSWSRVFHARNWLASKGLKNVTLCTADLFRIPLADDSIDVVYTSHTIEPNGGRESDAIQELVRVAREYVVLLEPGYEFASPECQARMESHGYCRDLRGAAERLGHEVVSHLPFPHSANPLNPTALTIIRKSPAPVSGDAAFVCPAYRTPLRQMFGVLYSDEALSAYPIVAGIPCLRVGNAIPASALEECLESPGAPEDEPLPQ